MMSSVCSGSGRLVLALVLVLAVAAIAFGVSAVMLVGKDDI
jgi:hypothetical protein